MKRSKYYGISYYHNEISELTQEDLKFWVEHNCPEGSHLFDEVWSSGAHYLYCDACGLKVYIDKIVLPNEEENNET